LQFLANKSLHLRNRTRQGVGYYLLLIGSHTLAYNWHQKQWPWMTLNAKIGVLWIFWQFCAATHILRAKRVKKLENRDRPEDRGQPAYEVFSPKRDFDWFKFQPPAFKESFIWWHQT